MNQYEILHFVTNSGWRKTSLRYEVHFEGECLGVFDTEAESKACIEQHSGCVYESSKAAKLDEL